MGKLKFMKRGFNPIEDKIEKNSKYNRDCKNCNSFFKAEGDDCELCQNPNTLEFDICTEGSRVWCCYWDSLKEKK